MKTNKIRHGDGDGQHPDEKGDQHAVPSFCSCVYMLSLPRSQRHSLVLMKHGHPTIEGDLRHEIEAHRRRDVLGRVAQLAHYAAEIPIIA